MIDKIVSFLAIIIDKWYFIILLILFCIYPLTIYFFEWLFYRQTSTKRTTNENSGLFYFKPKKAVKWFDFSSLIKTFKKVMDSEQVLGMIDKREVFSTYNSAYFDYTNEKDLWIDFIADTGDDFNSTATVFEALSEDVCLNFQKGKVLIIGGDLVYPHASNEEYDNRFKGPIRFVNPFNNGSTDIFATPGNHDWYDGLTAFSRMMFQGKTIGDYRTRQNRSYFVIKLRDNLHLLGIDNQLSSDIDIPQVNYFKDFVKSLLGVNQNLILLVAEPAWYTYKSEDRGKRIQKYDSLNYLIKELQESNKNAKIKLLLAGDIHHYNCYKAEIQNKDYPFPEYLVTSGGGGAYKHISTYLKKSITLDFNLKRENVEKKYEKQKKSYPNEGDSKKMVLKSLVLPFLPHNISLPFLMGFFSLLVTILFVKNTNYSLENPNTLLCLNCLPFFIFNNILSALSTFILPILVSGILYTMKPKELSKKESRTHSIILLLLFFSILFSQYGLYCFFHLLFLKIRIISNCNIFIIALTFMIVSGFVYSWLFGLTLFIGTTFFDLFTNETSSAAQEKEKNHFLRMKIEANRITIYVIGIAKNKKYKKWYKKELDKPKENDVRLIDTINIYF